jgi:adenosine kinase
LEKNGVDTSGAQVIPGVFTASFFVNTDLSNAQIASFYPGAMAHAVQLSLRSLERARPDLVVISPNDPEAMNLYVKECQQMDLPYVYDPSQQIVRLNEDDIRVGIRGAHALFANDYEAALIEKMTGWGPEQIRAENPDILIVITRGEKNTWIFKGPDRYEIPIVPPEKISDPTGIGDAFRGGFLTGYSFGLDLRVCGQMGTLAATYCLECDGPQGQCYSAHEFVDRYGSVFGGAEVLSVLIE